MITALDLARMLRLKRERAGLTQEEAAELMGVSRRQYADWECGRDLERYAAFISGVMQLDHAFFSQGDPGM